MTHNPVFAIMDRAQAAGLRSLRETVASRLARQTGLAWLTTALRALALDSVRRPVTTGQR